MFSLLLACSRGAAGSEQSSDQWGLETSPDQSDDVNCKRNLWVLKFFQSSPQIQGSRVSLVLTFLFYCSWQIQGVEGMHNLLKVIYGIFQC